MGLLYHASTKTDLVIIEPKRILYIGGKPVGKYVFASYNERYAAMYLVKLGNATLMEPRTDKPYIIIRNNPENFIASDTGGAIYTSSDLTFHDTPQIGLENTERVSRVSVIPMDKKIYKSSIEAMTGMNITIYFVNPKIFKRFLDIRDNEKLLPLIEPYTPK